MLLVAADMLGSPEDPQSVGAAFDILSEWEGSIISGSNPWLVYSLLIGRLAHYTCSDDALLRCHSRWLLRRFVNAQGLLDGEDVKTVPVEQLQKREDRIGQLEQEANTTESLLEEIGRQMDEMTDSWDREMDALVYSWTARRR